MFGRTGARAALRGWAASAWLVAAGCGAGGEAAEDQREASAQASAGRGASEGTQTLSADAHDAGVKRTGDDDVAAGGEAERAGGERGYDAGSAPDRNRVEPAQLCQRIAEINCAGEAHCCDDPGRTVEECKQDLIETCANELMLDRVAMQEITRFDAEAAERAYTELERRAAMCDPTVAQWGAAPDGLRGLLKGSVAGGDSCKPTQAVPDPVSLAAALLSCEHPETHACVYANPLEDWTCEPRSAAGGGCVTDNNCEDGLYCVVTAPGLAGMCTERKAVGDSCDGPTQCASLFCKGGSCVAADQQAAYCLQN